MKKLLSLLCLLTYTMTCVGQDPQPNVSSEWSTYFKAKKDKFDPGKIKYDQIEVFKVPGVGPDSLQILLGPSNKLIFFSTIVLGKCVDENSTVTLLFEDETVGKMKQTNDINCRGISLFKLDALENLEVYESSLKKKVVGIRVWTRKGNYDFDLSEEFSALLFNLIDAANSIARSDS